MTWGSGARYRVGWWKGDMAEMITYLLDWAACLRNRMLLSAMRKSKWQIVRYQRYSWACLVLIYLSSLQSCDQQWWGSSWAFRTTIWPSIKQAIHQAWIRQKLSGNCIEFESSFVGQTTCPCVVWVVLARLWYGRLTRPGWIPFLMFRQNLRVMPRD